MKKIKNDSEHTSSLSKIKQKNYLTKIWDRQCSDQFRLQPSTCLGHGRFEFSHWGKDCMRNCIIVPILTIRTLKANILLTSLRNSFSSFSLSWHFSSVMSHRIWCILPWSWELAHSRHVLYVSPSFCHNGIDCRTLLGVFSTKPNKLVASGDFKEINKDFGSECKSVDLNVKVQAQ